MQFMGGSFVQFEQDEFMAFSRNELVTTIASALDAACDEFPLLETCTIPKTFFGKQRQSFSMESYVRRLAEFLDCSNAAFVTALIYLDRLRVMNPANHVTPLNVHRLFATALLLAVKFHDDEHYANSYYAEAFGMRSLAEVNRLEVQMLQLLSYRLNVELKEYVLYKRYLQFSQVYVREEVRAEQFLTSAA